MFLYKNLGLLVSKQLNVYVVFTDQYELLLQLHSAHIVTRRIKNNNVRNKSRVASSKSCHFSSFETEPTYYQKGKQYHAMIWRSGQKNLDNYIQYFEEASRTVFSKLLFMVQKRLIVPSIRLETPDSCRKLQIDRFSFLDLEMRLVCLGAYV